VGGFGHAQEGLAHDRENTLLNQVHRSAVRYRLSYNCFKSHRMARRCSLTYSGAQSA
jgi:hypothetical protein